MFPWKTLASHRLFHVWIIQTILPETGGFRKGSWEGVLSEFSYQSWRHFKEPREELWSSAFFSSMVLAIAFSCFFISYLWSTRAILKESAMCVVRIPQHVTHTQIYLRLAMSYWFDWVILCLSVHLPFPFCSNHPGCHTPLHACQDIVLGALFLPLHGSPQCLLTSLLSLQGVCSEVFFHAHSK